MQQVEAGAPYWAVVLPVPLSYEEGVAHLVPYYCYNQGQGALFDDACCYIPVAGEGVAGWVACCCSAGSSGVGEGPGEAFPGVAYRAGDHHNLRREI